MKRKNKEEHKTAYKILVSILKPIFKLYYNPIIINQEIIPKEGPIIICSNHIHLFDQNTAIISTKRMIHYLAKKEHLDGKFGIFFRLVGCIRVDREIHDEKAKNKAIELLERGYAIGLFPEGTRNQLHGKKDLNQSLYKLYQDRYSYKKFIKILKENQVCTSEYYLLNKLLEEKRITNEEYYENALNIIPYLKELLNNNRISSDEFKNSLLLPLKYGAISLASKTKATIIPCAVTGKYKFRKKLTLKYGTPIKVDNTKDYDYYLNKLKEEIIDLKLNEN